MLGEQCRRGGRPGTSLVAAHPPPPHAPAPPSPRPAGAWTPQLAAWLPQAQLPDVSGLKVHSIVLQDNAGTTADALFLAYRSAGTGLVAAGGPDVQAAWLARWLAASPATQWLPPRHTPAPPPPPTPLLLHVPRGTDGKSLEPEIYPRPNNTVYVCGVSDEGEPVPATAADVTPRPQAIATLRSVAASVSQARCRGRGAGDARCCGCCGCVAVCGACMDMRPHSSRAFVISLARPCCSPPDLSTSSAGAGPR